MSRIPCPIRSGEDRAVSGGSSWAADVGARLLVCLRKEAYHRIQHTLPLSPILCLPCCCYRGDSRLQDENLIVTRAGAMRCYHTYLHRARRKIQDCEQAPWAMVCGVVWREPCVDLMHQTHAISVPARRVSVASLRFLGTPSHAPSLLPLLT